ncbi:thiamine-phosphate kinase [Alkalicoccus chagannorensis]|uniref:thiamine-phosphate kinase n=1 Tax=Alkalicoccus chagannorensis TaxID=427072 RepID=UPI00047D331E|nr:thiamine-phosphate kinase [Alkalicoccus chagannorensis]
MNEFDWIRSIQPDHIRRDTVRCAIGDDAAVTAGTNPMDTVYAVDTMVEGVHFTKETMPVDAVGWKALAANVSDLAAMGAEPLYYLVSIAVPKEGWTQEETTILYDGMKKLAEQENMDLIGGDTVSTKDKLVLTITVIGRVEQGRALLRSLARTGDVVFLTGAVGFSAKGLKRLLQEGSRAWGPERDIQSHQYPVPHTAAGRKLTAAGIRAAVNDVSDGIGREAAEIAEASGCSLHLEWDKLPELSQFNEASEEEQEAWLLYGGEDFCLLGTMSREDWELIGSPDWKVVGEVKEGSGVYLRRDGENRLLENSGYSHF